METCVTFLSDQHAELRSNCDKIKILRNLSKHQNMKMLTFDMPWKSVNTKLKEDLLDLKSRSIRDNLIFTNITEQQEEDSEQVLVGSLQNKLNLTDI